MIHSPCLPDCPCHASRSLRHEDQEWEEARDTWRSLISILGVSSMSRPRPPLWCHLRAITNITARDNANENRDHWSNTQHSQISSSECHGRCPLHTWYNCSRNVICLPVWGLMIWLLSECLTPPVWPGVMTVMRLWHTHYSPADFCYRQLSTGARSSRVYEVSSKTQTDRSMSRSGIIKSSSKVPVSGVKGNMSYKITNTFITHLTETTVNTICVKRFLKRQEFCIFSRVASQCLLLRA